MTTETTQAPATAEAAERIVQQIQPNRIRNGDFVRTVYTATAMEGNESDDLLRPDYWAHYAANFKPWDRIEVVANDGTWWAELVVLESGRNWTKMHMMRKISLTTADVAQSQAAKPIEYVVLHRGPHCKWSVRRASDNQVVFENGETRDAAETWLKNHMVSLAK
jgi:hypothetical protein